MKKIIFLITVLLVTNAYAQEQTEQAVIELPMNDEVVQIVQEDPVVQKVITEQAPTQVVQVPAAPIPTTKKVITTRQVVTTQPVAQPATVNAAPPQQSANIQQPVVVQPVVVQPVVLQPKAIEPATPKVPSVETSEKPAVTDAPKANAKPEDVDTNENIKIKRTKDGTNVYNFNFYNAKQKSKESAPAAATTTKVKIPKVEEKQTRGGSGPQVEYYYTDYLNSGEIFSDNLLPSETGYKLSYKLMHKGSGFYIAPGYIKSYSDIYRDNSGYLLRIGKTANDYRKFFFDYGVELSRVKGDLIYGWEGLDDGNIEVTNMSVYINPSLRWGSFGLSWPILIGKSKIELDYSYYDIFSDFSQSQYLSEDKTFFTLAMNASFYF